MAKAESAPGAWAQCGLGPAGQVSAWILPSLERESATLLQSAAVIYCYRVTYRELRFKAPGQGSQGCLGVYLPHSRVSCAGSTTVKSVTFDFDYSQET